MIPIWSVQTTEHPNGHYVTKCIGPSGLSVEYNGGEEHFDRIVEAIFAIESLNVGPHLAALSTIVSFHRLSNYEYHDKFFGSWRINSNSESFIYDGKDGWLLHKSNGQDKKIMTCNANVKIEDVKYCIKNLK